MATEATGSRQPTQQGLDHHAASLLLLDSLRRFALDGAHSAFPECLHDFARDNPPWIAAHMFVLVRAFLWCQQPGAVEELLLLHARNFALVNLKLWALQSCAEPRGYRGKARLVRELETAFVNGGAGEAKQLRAEVYDRSAGFLAALLQIPSKLRSFAVDLRPSLARAMVGSIAAAHLPAELMIPTMGHGAVTFQAVGAPEGLVRVFETRERCPVLVVFEVITGTGGSVPSAAPRARRAASGALGNGGNAACAVRVSCSVDLEGRVYVGMRVGANAAEAPSPRALCWEAATARERSRSPYASDPSWGLAGVIVKADANLVVEEFAMLLLTEIQDIFAAEQTPLQLRCYAVKAVTPTAGFVEYIPDARSLHDIKREAASLGEHFRDSFPRDPGPEDGRVPYAEAVERFVCSTAAYAVACHVLQIRDRHNGNVLLTAAGQLVHVDFGFVLGMAPGGALSVESAPFKLTTEFVDLMGGTDSPEFRRFRSLCAVGFLALKHKAPRLLAHLETCAALARQGDPVACRQLPCLERGDDVVARVRERMMLHMSNDAIVSRTNSLIDESLDAWGTWLYDAYQQSANRIRH